MDILFLCDGTKCGIHHYCGECHHTLNPDYAKNFLAGENDRGKFYLEQKQDNHGYWIYKKNQQGRFDVCCSRCDSPRAQVSKNFCACCGADMRKR